MGAADGTEKKNSDKHRGEFHFLTFFVKEALSPINEQARCHEGEVKFQGVIYLSEED
jgi:hypothetical protein